MVSGVMVRVLGVISRIFLILVLTHCPHALWSCSMARVHSHPLPEHKQSPCSETAERVKKGLGLAVSLILRSVSEDSAGKGHSDSVVPPAG